MGLILKRCRLQTAKLADEEENKKITIWIFDCRVVSLPSLISEKEMVAGCCKQYQRKPREAAGLLRLLNYWGLAEPPWKAPKKKGIFQLVRVSNDQSASFQMGQKQESASLWKTAATVWMLQCGQFYQSLQHFLMKRRAKNDTKSFSLLQTDFGHG